MYSFMWLYMVSQHLMQGLCTGPGAKVTWLCDGTIILRIGAVELGIAARPS